MAPACTQALGVDTQTRWQSERGNLEGEQGAVGVHAKLPPHCLVLTAVIAVLVQGNLQVMHLQRKTIWSTLASSFYFLACLCLPIAICLHLSA